MEVSRPEKVAKQVLEIMKNKKLSPTQAYLELTEEEKVENSEEMRAMLEIVKEKIMDKLAPKVRSVIGSNMQMGVNEVCSKLDKEDIIGLKESDIKELVRTAFREMRLAEKNKVLSHGWTREQARYTSGIANKDPKE